MSAADLRPVHAAALRLARIVEHAGGQLQFGFGERIRRGGGGEIRHRIIGGIEAVGGRILQPRDHALGAGGQRAALGPERREVARVVEFLDRGALVLAVEIAQRLARRSCRAACRRPADRRRATLLAAFTGSAAGAAAVAGAAGRRLRGGVVAAGRRAFARSLGGASRRRCGGDVGRLRLGASAASALRLDGFAAPTAVVSSLKSAAVGRRDVGGFGARDRGIDREFGGAGARRIRLAASAEVADTVRKVAATAINTRSNPARLVRTVTHRRTPWAKLPRHGTVFGIVGHSLRESAGFCRTLHACTQRFNADDTRAP